MEGNVMLNNGLQSSSMDMVGPAKMESYEEGCCLLETRQAPMMASSSSSSLLIMPPSSSSSFDEKNARHPRWTKEETLILVESKRKQEEEDATANVTGSSSGSGPNEKWDFVHSLCRMKGVERDPQQCRKRWSNLFGEFKKIKDWQGLTRGAESYWGLRREQRKEAKLPAAFEYDIFTLMDGFVTSTRSSPPLPPPVGIALPEIWSAHEDEAEIDCPDDFVAGETPPLLPDQTCPPMLASFREELGDHMDEVYGKRKKRRPEETTIVSAIESTGKALETTLLKSSQAHIDAYNRNCELDRLQRKHTNNDLVAVLGKLAEAITKVADKL